MSCVFIAGFDTETNSFSPMATDAQAFRETLLAFGDATARPLNTCSAQLALWRERAGALGMGVQEGLCAVAQPGGPIPRAVYEDLRDRLLDDLRAASPDLVLLALHGAAIAEGYDDIEGDLLERARGLVGPGVFLGATLDPHAHLTARMIAHADALIAYKEYPHTDILDRAGELLALAVAAHAGKMRPVMAAWDCRMIGTFPTQSGPMREFVGALLAAERGTPRLLSLSLIHGFAHGDVAEVGARMLAITDGDAALAATLAEAHGRRFVALRNETAMRLIDTADALARIRACPVEGRPLVLADTGDNPGGGAPGDATFLLRACIERGITDVAFALFWDPEAVDTCCRAGVGAQLDVELGGRFGDVSGPPVYLRAARVQAIGRHMEQRFGDVRLPMGNAVRLQAGGLTIIVNDRRTQVFDPVCLTALGDDPAQYRAIIVKSLNHFAALFAPLACELLYVATPGATSPGDAEMRARNRPPSYWPRDADPWAR